MTNICIYNGLHLHHITKIRKLSALIKQTSGTFQMYFFSVHFLSVYVLPFIVTLKRINKHNGSLIKFGLCMLKQNRWIDLLNKSVKLTGWILMILIYRYYPGHQKVYCIMPIGNNIISTRWQQSATDQNISPIIRFFGLFFIF